MPVHPNSLRNLKPVRRGYPPRNPRGRNQYSSDRERRKRFKAVIEALYDCRDEDLRQRLLEAVARQVVDGAIAGDPRLLLRFVDALWPPPSRLRSQRWQSAVWNSEE